MRHALALIFLTAAPVYAVEPADVVVVANKTVPESVRVAEHYLAKRKVPAANLVLLDLPAGEDISRADYDSRLAGPLRKALADRKDAVKVILTVYGVPLRVGRQEPGADEKAALAKLAPELDAARKAVEAMEKDKADAKDVAAARDKRDALDRRRRALSHDESHAAVDSELMLLWWDRYPLDRWVPNPLYFQGSERYRTASPPAVMTCRLDGPTAQTATRLVDDALAVEENGLTGRVVIDARGIRFDPKGKDTGHGYAGYDESMRETATLFRKTPLPVTLDDKEPVLPAGAAAGVALYCGWYSHANFVDCCGYERGAIAWHLASSEATTLRRPDTKVWCPNLLKKGVAATLGPVAEPYTIGFPKPAEFFGFLAAGDTLVEAYARSALFSSWMTVLVGDPLYRPFGRVPLLTRDDVRPSPVGGQNRSP
ncbi:MAG: TIGR03790 family protein [Gemmataceae bacterium]